MTVTPQNDRKNIILRVLHIYTYTERGRVHYYYKNDRRRYYNNKMLII